MKEELLHFIWKLQLFTPSALKTTEGEPVQVLSAGLHNSHSGPDFFNAKIQIGKQLWAGNVEIHLQASDWYAHYHEKDKRYDSVILHVVWDNDTPIFTSTNNPLPTLKLKDFVQKSLLEKYKQLFLQQKKWIYCENDIKTVDSFALYHWFERLYIQRLEQKTKLITSILQKNNNDWEATLFILLAKNFGLKVNGEAFYQMALATHFSIVRKEMYQQEVLEALFMGQSGLLSEKKEFLYYQQLQKEYKYLQKKHRLQPIFEKQMQFFRIRPTNFPTLRLSQLAMLYHKNQQLFSELIEITDVKKFYKILKVTTSPFWETHYTFDKESKYSVKKISNSFIDLLIINTIIPLKFAYNKALGKPDFSSVLKISQQLTSEKNTIITHFKNIGIITKNAFESQALLQLKNEMCNHKKCLQCTVGKELLKGD